MVITVGPDYVYALVPPSKNWDVKARPSGSDPRAASPVFKSGR